MDAQQTQNVLPACVVERELPERPDGWAKVFIASTGWDDNQRDTYRMLDDKGIKTPILWIGSMTRRGVKSGYYMVGCPDLMEWAALREKWLQWLEFSYLADELKDL